LGVLRAHDGPTDLLTIDARHELDFTIANQTELLGEHWKMRIANLETVATDGRPHPPAQSEPQKAIKVSEVVKVARRAWPQPTAGTAQKLRWPQIAKRRAATRTQTGSRTSEGRSLAGRKDSQPMP
jgi:hypothetical protein